MMRLIVQACAAFALTGCVVAPPVAYVQPPPQQQTPFVAVPGPGKTELAFRQDDSACRNAPPPVQPTALQSTAAPAQPAGDLTPGVVYLQCMEARNNLVQPMQPAAPQPVYAYLQPYPVYVGPWYDYGYPWYYGSIGFGGFGFYGYRGFGYHGAYGFRGGYGGYHGWGGYRGGGGWGGGGWGGGPGGFRGGFRGR